MSNSIKQLQSYLNQKGNNLTLDGIFGAKTSAAIEGLNIPQYLKYALKEVGTHEIKGKQHSKRVIEYHKTTAGKYSQDEVPWCGSFVNWSMIKGGHKDTVKYPERAKSWLSYGETSHSPMTGSIAVKSRVGGGHVAFVLGRGPTDSTLWCVGGNQNDEVNIALYNEKDFIDFRLPKGAQRLALSKFSLSITKNVREA